MAEGPSDHKMKGYLQVKHNPLVSAGKSRTRLLRKCWRRQWLVLDIVETVDQSPALIARIYASHHHEDRSLPLSTVTLPDVHALHRAQSRSHQYAFSIDGGSQSLVLSGASETETQQWMTQVRDLLWPRSIPSSIWPKQDCIFEVSLIDNVYSDIARLRGFYGQIVIDCREVILVEARSGADQVRWPLKALKKWFVARPDGALARRQEDRDRIVVIITHRNCSSGEGIFTFYSSRAKEIVHSLHRALNTLQKQQQQLRGGAGKKMNPLLAFLRRSGHSQPPRHTSASPPRRQQQEQKATAANKGQGTMVKSVSVMEQLKGPQARGSCSTPEPDEGGFESASKVRSSCLVTSCVSANTNSPPKKSASESDLLGVAASGTKENPTTNLEKTQVSGASAVDGCDSALEGFYRSFDELDDDIDLLGSNSNDDVVLRRVHNESNQLNEDSGEQSARCSFNSSVDSGRVSNDTYAETSNSSVTSSNRAFGDGDSGTQCSVEGSDCSTTNNGKRLDVVKEKESSPDYPPFDREVYGQSVSIADKSSTSTLCSRHMMAEDGETASSVDPTYSRIEYNSDSQQVRNFVPPPLPPRFATVRKSFTLPHGMNMSGSEGGVASGGVTPTTPSSTPIYAVIGRNKRKNLTNFFGLNDQGPGSPSREVAQMVALQGLRGEANSPSLEGETDRRKNLGKYLGIQGVPHKCESERGNMTLPKAGCTSESQCCCGHNVGNGAVNTSSTAPRSRPKTLGFKGMLQQLSPTKNTRQQLNKAQNKALSRLAFSDSVETTMARSCPTTPNNDHGGSPRKKGIAMLLGFSSSHQNKQMCAAPPISLPPPPPNGILKKSSLSNSTPMDLENYCADGSRDVNLTEINSPSCYEYYSPRCWQSNDGLATPGSLHGGGVTPLGSPRQQQQHQHPARLEASSPNTCGPKQSGSLFSLACTAAIPPPPPPLRSSITCSLQRGASLNQPLRNFQRQPPEPPKRMGSLPRSSTMSEIDPPSAVRRDQPQQPVNWVTRSAREDLQLRRHSGSHFQQQVQAPAAGGGVYIKRRSHSTVACTDSLRSVSTTGSPSRRIQASTSLSLERSTRHRGQPFDRFSSSRRSNHRFSLEDISPPSEKQEAFHHSNNHKHEISGSHRQPQCCSHCVLRHHNSGVLYASMAASTTKQPDYIDVSSGRKFRFIAAAESSSSANKCVFETRAIVHCGEDKRMSEASCAARHSPDGEAAGECFPQPPPPLEQKSQGDIEENI